MKSSTFADVFDRWTLYLALAIALVATFGSLYFSEVRHYLPCNLCWYQRIAMYPLVVIIAVGLLRFDFNVPYFVLPLSLIGQGIATYHYLLEKTNIFAAPTSCQVGVPCTTPWINWAGFITIPFLAMTAFFLITILCLVTMTRGEAEIEDDDEEVVTTPWIPVASVLAVVIILFVIFYQVDPVRAESLTLTTPAVGEMTPINATATPPIVTSAFVTESTSAGSAEASTGELALGQSMYSKNCSVCHGADAQGVQNLGTALVDSLIIHEQSDAEALAFIRQGRLASDPGNTTGMTMPPSGAHPEMSDEEILAIVAYLRAQ